MEDYLYEQLEQSYFYKLTISGGSISWCSTKPNKGKKAPNRYSKQSSKTVKRKKARRRSIATLATLHARLTKKPSVFITLIFDTKVKAKWKTKECIALFNKFRRYLERSYSECWFIFVMEWSYLSGVHYHLIGRMGKKHVPWGKLRKKWQKITGSSERKTINFKKYKDLHISYVTKKIKEHNTLKLMKKLQGKSFWGAIHRKDMPLAPIKELVLDENQWEIFRLCLKRQIINNSSAESSINRLSHHASCLCYCTSKMIQEAINEALAYEEIIV
ncbi:rolling circle replication-associated protein [Desulfovibrio litoralis]|uniref:Replication-associated protein ORF2/G2P domain-containing protein n=1 Tax=Desulfovibrio litoralis DSM 11393 TaxID=1121455 RepID=A0A1M7S0T0_9BACT|nr:hypothetical protein [Desulfovibrio litoralis]SHN51932.1 hypothetical protein SAMN02745728_00398 [Desulfovibrio litoralis DSM 11393]